MPCPICSILTPAQWGGGNFIASILQKRQRRLRGRVARPGPRGWQRLLGDPSPGCLAPEATAVGTGAVQCALDVVSLTLVLQLLLSPQG